MKKLLFLFLMSCACLGCGRGIEGDWERVTREGEVIEEMGNNSYSKYGLRFKENGYVYHIEKKEHNNEWDYSSTSRWYDNEIIPFGTWEATGQKWFSDTEYRITLGIHFETPRAAFIKIEKGRMYIYDNDGIDTAYFSPATNEYYVADSY